MIKIFKHMKHVAVPIIAIVVLLFIQATCDLSLPQYTSNIVNVGIMQGGVENASPNALRRSELEKLMLFMTAEKKEYVQNAYVEASKEQLSAEEYEKYLKLYPEIANTEIVVRKNLTTVELATVNSYFAMPAMVISQIEQGGEDMDKIVEQLKMEMLASSHATPNEGMGSIIFDENTTLIDILMTLPAEAATEMVKAVEEKLSAMPESIMAQSAVGYAKAEHAAIGADVEKIQTNYILTVGVNMLLIALVSALAAILVGLLSSRFAAQLGRTLRQKVFTNVVDFSSNEFNQFSTASLITRSTNDIQQVQFAMVMMLRIVFYAPMMGIGGVLKVLDANVDMVWIIWVVLLTVLCFIGTLFIIAMPKFKKLQKLVDKVNLVAREILIGLPVIRAFSTEKHEEKRFDDANAELTRTNLFVNRVMTLMMPTLMLIMNGTSILIMWVGSSQIDAGNMQVGDLMAFIQYAVQIIMSFVMISAMSIMLPRATVSAHRINEVIDTKVSVTDPKNPKPFNSSKKGFVEFKNVSFKYPLAEENVISNVSFTAKPGETTAIIGSTGSGKSTLVNLLPRFYDVTEGAILVDGVDVREASQVDLRDRIGFVPQKGVLFSGTIESNIKYGAPDITDAQMEKAAEIAQATAFVEEKENKYQDAISQGGSNVSGGQKQRLAIARAIAKSPEIYVFDDSFSALDFKTDLALRNALKSETKESTVIIIAQRISTILHAEQIIVLDEGDVVGIGTHKELMQTCDVYKQIALSQLSKEELNNE